jgi:acyl-CoA synthetase (NDP forming)
MTTSTDAISALLTPKSVAILGAADDPARIGGRPLRYLREAGYAGKVYPVNPNRKTVQGLEAWPSIDALPEAPDVALVALPAALVMDNLRQCAARGVKSAIVFSAGFAETGADGASAQQAMRDLARSTGMRILGPNCLGAFNAELGFYGTFSQVLDNARPTPGPVAIATQSGAYGSHISYLARERGMGVKYWLTTGNESDIELAEGLLWLAQQPDVKVIMAYVEGVKNGALFIEALETARRNRKAIVMMKVGRSSVGAEAAGSHTAALAGSDAVYDAVFRQYGVFRARTTDEQIDVAYACARGIWPVSNKLGIFTLSGGFGIQTADAAELAGLDVAPMPDDAQAELKQLLPYASPRNPVDATAQALTEMNLITANMQLMLGKGGYDAVLGIFGSTPAAKTFSVPLREALRAGIAGFAGRLMILTMIAPREIVRDYEAAGFLIFEDNDRAVAALAGLTWIARQWQKQPDPVSAASAPLWSDPGHPVSEHEAKQVLSKAGVPVPDERLVTSAEAAVNAAKAIGLPVVMKIVSADIAHKTEIGGVLLNVQSDAAVAEGFATLMQRGRTAAPRARIDGVLVAPMVKGGVETVIGVTRDPTFGPVVMFGLGGIFVEVLKDVTFRAAPFGKAEALAMIGEIRGKAMLDGARGQAPADVDALAQVLSDVSRFAAANATALSSIDINPFIARPKGQPSLALDALIIGGA